MSTLEILESRRDSLNASIDAIDQMIAEVDESKPDSTTTDLDRRRQGMVEELTSVQTAINGLTTT